MKTKSKFITKHFNFLWHAEKFQNRLYNEYDKVTLINFPRFSNAGCYTWEVASPLSTRVANTATN